MKLLKRFFRSTKTEQSADLSLRRFPSELQTLKTALILLTAVGNEVTNITTACILFRKPSNNVINHCCAPIIGKMSVFSVFISFLTSGFSKSPKIEFNQAKGSTLMSCNECA